MTLPPYNPSAKCVKCGNEKPRSIYHAANTCLYLRMRDFNDIDYGLNKMRVSACCLPGSPDNHMLRHCSNCGYEWLEAPIDTQPKPIYDPLNEYIGLSCGHRWPMYKGYRCPKCGDVAAEKITPQGRAKLVGDIMSTAIWVFGWYWPQDITESGYPIVRPMVEFGEMTREEAESLTQQVKALKDKPIFAS